MNPLIAILFLFTISLRAEPSEEFGAIVKMNAKPNLESLAEHDIKPKPGAKVIADIYCGRKPAGFVFLHEVIEWCHKFFFGLH